MTRTKQEQIDSVNSKIRQLENQKKQLLQQQREQARKARTRRLIERGAILESLIDGADTLTNKQIQEFLAMTVTGEHAKKALAGIVAQADGATGSNTADHTEGTG